MITFISESRQASWFFLFKGNGVASYIYFHGLMWASGVLFGAWERALTHFHIWVSSVELILAAWLHWCMCLSLICSSLQEGTTHFMTNSCSNDSVYRCWIHSVNQLQVRHQWMVLRGGVPFACRDVLFHIDSTTIFVTKHVVICSFVAWYKNLIQHLPTVFLEQTEIKNSLSWFLHIIQYANKF